MKLLFTIVLSLLITSMIMRLVADVVFDYISIKAGNICFDIALGLMTLTTILTAVIGIIAIITVT